MTTQPLLLIFSLLLHSKLGLCIGLGGGGGHGFLIVSSPSEATISYARILTPAEQSRGEQMKTQELVKDGLLKAPSGLAMDRYRGVLYVADPTAETVFAVEVWEGSFRSGKLSAGKPKAVLTGIVARWVAVDSQGNLLSSAASDGQIWMLSAGDVVSATRGDIPAQVVGSAASKATELYAAGTVKSLKDPEGLAVMGSNVIWANGAVGASDASIVRGLKDTTDDKRSDAITALASNGKPAQGVCLSGSRVFYTDGAANIYSLPSAGGNTVLVSEGLKEGRGCAFDGDGTLFFADEADGKVFALSGGAMELTARPLTLMVTVPGAFGVAVLTSSAWVAASVRMYLFLAVLVAVCRS